MSLASALRHVRCAVCAVGCLDVPVEQFFADEDSPHFRIFGTGFLARSNTVLTNRHVLLRLLAYIQKNGIPKDRCFLQFNYPVGERLQQAWCRFGKYGIIADQPHDFALIDFVRRPEGEFEQCQPVEFPACCDVQVGSPIAAFGFPFGTTGLTRDTEAGTKIYRFGPVLQQGYVGALAPYDNARVVHRLLLDLRTWEGMSGSPIFQLESGRVLGIHDAGREAVTAFAIPLSMTVVNQLLAVHDETKIGDKSVIPIDAVLRCQPDAGAA